MSKREIFDFVATMALLAGLLVLAWYAPPGCDHCGTLDPILRH